MNDEERWRQRHRAHLDRAVQPPLYLTMTGPSVRHAVNIAAGAVVAEPDFQIIGHKDEPVWDSVCGRYKRRLLDVDEDGRLVPWDGEDRGRYRPCDFCLAEIYNHERGRRELLEQFKRDGEWLDLDDG